MNQFNDHLLELLADFGEVQIKRMFGGHGVFREGLMFALIADDVVYLKADADNASAFDEQGLEPFTYTKNGKTMHLSYRRAPDDYLERAELACAWSRLAFDAALRNRKPARKPRPRKSK